MGTIISSILSSQSDQKTWEIEDLEALLGDLKPKRRKLNEREKKLKFSIERRQKRIKDLELQVEKEKEVLSYALQERLFTLEDIREINRTIGDIQYCISLLEKPRIDSQQPERATE